MILLTFIILAILGVAAWAILGLTSGPKFANVPDVAGKTTSQAFNILSQAGFNPRIDDPIANNAKAGTVIGTSPAAGVKLKKGSVVHIINSSGPDYVPVPDVTGKTEAAARSALQAAGLKVGKVTKQSSETVRSGLVISQTPNGGSLQRGQSVDLVVSSGKPLVTVPSVTGLSQQDAEDALHRANLNPQVINEDVSTCHEVPGNVCRQDPTAGQQVTEGSTVTIFVATTGGPPPSETPSATPTPTPSTSF